MQRNTSEGEYCHDCLKCIGFSILTKHFWSRYSQLAAFFAKQL